MVIIRTMTVEVSIQAVSPELRLSSCAIAGVAIVTAPTAAANIENMRTCFVMSGSYNACSLDSPVRIRTAVLRSYAKIFPSPICPV